MLLLVTVFLGLNPWTNNEVQDIKTDLLEILDYYEPYELSSYKSDIEEVMNLIAEFETNGDEALLKTIKENYIRIKYAHNHVIDMSYEMDQLKGQYFKVWERVSYLKKRVDNLFTYELKGGSLALDVNQADKKVRKKSIYLAYTSVYDSYMKKLKGTNECDYQSKIDFLNKIDPILVTSEQLLLNEDTKNLEKELKSIDNPEEYERVLLSYP